MGVQWADTDASVSTDPLRAHAFSNSERMGVTGAPLALRKRNEIYIHSYSSCSTISISFALNRSFNFKKFIFK